jgi:inner membrane protein
VVVAIVVLLLICDWAYERVHTSVPLAGPLDESAHVLFVALLLLALGRRLGDRLGRAALVASVAIDVDHVPAELGASWLTAGTPRPYTHSVLTLVVVALTVIAWRNRRLEVVGVLLGLTAHFWRDLGETGSGVALLWPLSSQSDSVPHAAFLASVALASVLALRSRRQSSDWPGGP